MLIHSGVKVTLAKDNEISVTHRLGGTITVVGIFGMARVEDSFADALGLALSGDGQCSTAAQISEEMRAKNPEPAQPEIISESDIWEAAKTVYDPEIPVNIVDLGLVYRVEMSDAGDGKKRVEADITLTAPGCPMASAIAEDLRARIESLPSVVEAKVSIVWEPPWNKDMMSEEARMILGLA